MALSGPQYSTDELTRTKGEMEAFLADEGKLSQARELLKVVPKDSMEAKTLKMLERTFGCYIMESEEAKTLRAEATKIEGGLEAARNNLILGATIDGKFEEMSSVGLRNKVRVDPDEAIRKACYEGLTKIGDFVTENGFVELIKVRNRMAKKLGFIDFYDYKVSNAEGFGKIALFEILDNLEAGTRPIMESARKHFAAEKGGESALSPWNQGFLMSGDITRRMDPYFPFERSVEQWGRSFAAMNISYKQATMDLDLLDRKGKYSNGFCHWPQPAWVKPDGTWQPSTAHFTSLADPSAIGSGYTGLTTLMHEGKFLSNCVFYQLCCFGAIRPVTDTLFIVLTITLKRDMQHTSPIFKCPLLFLLRNARQLQWRTLSCNQCFLTLWLEMQIGWRNMQSRERVNQSRGIW